MQSFSIAKYPHLAGILFSMIFGLTFMFSKVLLETMSPLGLIAYRFLIAIIVFEIVRRLKWVTIDLKNKPLQPLLLVALFQPILYFLFETIGLTFIRSSEAGMMIALIPIVVALISPLFGKEYPSWIQFLFISLSVSGVVFINVMKASVGDDVNVIGVVLVFMAVVSAALFNMFSRRGSTHFRPAEITYVMMLTGAVVFNIIYIVELVLQDNVGAYLGSLSVISIGPLLYLGIIASSGGFFLVNTSLSKLPAHVSSVYANLATVVSVIAGVVVLQESISWFHYVGAAMIITGVYGTARFRRKVSV